jgi:hypothetical protein
VGERGHAGERDRWTSEMSASLADEIDEIFLDPTQLHRSTQTAASITSYLSFEYPALLHTHTPYIHTCPTGPHTCPTRPYIYTYIHTPSDTQNSNIHQHRCMHTYPYPTPYTHILLRAYIPNPGHVVRSYMDLTCAQRHEYILCMRLGAHDEGDQGCLTHDSSGLRA